MAQKFRTPIDLTGLELLNFLVQLLGSAPTGVTARVYYDSTLNKLRYYNGTAWVNADGSDLPDGTVTSAKIANGTIVNEDISASAAIALSKLATDPLARANHTGTQTASTISDFDTQVRTSRLDQMAAPTSAVGFNGQRITNLGTPTADTDAANKAYVDAARSGLDVKQSVRAATTADITLSGTQTIDGVVLTAGDRVLVKNQATGSENGIYTVAAGAWARATDADTDAEVNGGLFAFVEEGTANGDSGWVLTTDNPITLGTTSLAFAKFSSTGDISAGSGLTKTGNSLDVGAGVGISVGPDAVSVDTAVVARKYTALLGNGAATTINVPHTLGNKYVTVQVFDAATDELFGTDVTLVDANNAQVTFATAPANNSVRVVVVG